MFIDFRIHWNTLMKILYMKGYKWLLSQNQRLRNETFGYRRYEALVKHIKSFFKKHYSERTSVPGLSKLFITPHLDHGDIIHD